MRKGVAALLLALWAPCFAAPGDAGSGPETVAAVARSYFDALVAGDYAQAYGCLGKADRAALSEARFAELQEAVSRGRRLTGYRIVGIEPRAGSPADSPVYDVTVRLEVVSLRDYAVPLTEMTAVAAREETGVGLTFGYRGDAAERYLAEAAEQAAPRAQTAVDQAPVGEAAFGNPMRGWSLERFVAVFDEVIRRRMERYGVVGASAALVADNRIAWQRAYGLADVRIGRAVTTDTVFEVGSISKSVAGWAVLSACDRGLLDLDTPAERTLTRWHLPPSPYDASGVTVRRLLDHRSGLTIAEERGSAGRDPRRERVPTLVEFLAGSLYPETAARLTYPPGSRYEYSPAGYALLQLLIEEVTGQPFASYVAESVLGPLGMNASTYAREEVPPENRACGYDPRGKELPAYVFTELAAGGLQSTAGDIARFVVALNQTAAPESPAEAGGVLAPGDLAALRSVEFRDYLFGHFVYASPGKPIVVHHQGSTRGWKSLYAALPERGSGLVILTNSDNGPAVSQFCADLWLDWQVGIGNAVFQTIPTTEQRSRDRSERAAVGLVAALGALGLAVLAGLVGGVVRGRRLPFFREAGSALRPLGAAVTLAAVAAWWGLLAPRFYLVSPFSPASSIGPWLGAGLTAWGAALAVALLFPRVSDYLRARRASGSPRRPGRRRPPAARVT